MSEWVLIGKKKSHFDVKSFALLFLYFKGEKSNLYFAILKFIFEMKIQKNDFRKESLNKKSCDYQALYVPQNSHFISLPVIQTQLWSLFPILVNLIYKVTSPQNMKISLENVTLRLLLRKWRNHNGHSENLHLKIK